MVKTPKTRHSKSRREPMTIELEPGAVSRIGDEPAATEPNAEAAAEQMEQVSQPDMTEDRPAAEAAAETSPEEQPPAADAPDEPAAQTTGYGFDAPPPAGKAGDEGLARGEAAGPRRGGGMNAVAAGLVGAVIALAGAGALQYGGVLGTPGGSFAQVNSEIAALKGELAAARQGNSASNDALARLNDFSAALDKLRADLAAVQKTVQAAGGGNDTAALEALGDKVAALETELSSLKQAGSQQQPVDLGPLNERLDALDTEVKSATEAATTENGRVAALEQSVSQLSGKVEAQASQPKIALAIAASALKSALDRGAPFASELDTFAAIAPDAPQVAALRPYAEKGVASRADIAAGMDAAANAMVAAGQPVDENASLAERLFSSAKSLVKVRPIGAVEGPGVPETVARMEAAVKQGDYARALAEYDTLPEAAKAAGAEYAAEIKARMDAEAQVDALVSDAMKA
ncbi:COG4223 family protein [Mesorhizobium sp. PUT5]|uniref:COG4223 family protein n=1 Tax=Mesorhizobium sp. PUT5 TaxID=3454629 RepID=UPI003FA47357